MGYTDTILAYKRFDDPVAAWISLDNKLEVIQH